MIKNTFKIVRKEGWDLNPDDDIVNNIIEELAVNYGHCPTHVENRIGHDQCPCSSWLTNSKCYCKLYTLKETWKDIKGFEGYYQVSSFGRVKSVERVIYKSDNTIQTLQEHILNPYVNQKRHNYTYVYLRKGGKKYPKFVHRLVAEAFLPNLNNLPQVNHKDENPKNNKLDNLEWCDAKYNNNYGTKPLKSKENAPKVAVQQYDLQGNFIASYNSQMEAARQTGTRQGSIASCLGGRAKTANGYIWKKQ